MFTIVMNSDKSLSKRCDTILHQGENLVDVVRFLIPQTYEALNLADFTVCLSYIDPANIVRNETLFLQDSNYKECMLYYCLPVTSNLTKFAGDITVHLVLNGAEGELMHSGDAVITITPVQPCYNQSGSTDEGENKQEPAHMELKENPTSETAGTVGQICINTEDDTIFICTDATAGACVWRKVPVKISDLDNDLEVVAPAEIDEIVGDSLES